MRDKLTMPKRDSLVHIQISNKQAKTRKEGRHMKQAKKVEKKLEYKLAPWEKNQSESAHRVRLK